MKEIFDSMREQFETRKIEAETRMSKLIDEEKGYGCVYSETDVEEFSANTWADAISIVDKAEEKWKEDCCEWVPFGYYQQHSTMCGMVHAFNPKLISYEFCPYCGKRIKIAEVE